MDDAKMEEVELATAVERRGKSGRRMGGRVGRREREEREGVKEREDEEEKTEDEERMTGVTRRGAFGVVKEVVVALTADSDVVASVVISASSRRRGPKVVVLPAPSRPKTSLMHLSAIGG